ncbi:MAG: CinA family protein [Proteobacteria bacterium]|nr:CinA family protein [Pseudomonadota bacterium]
MTQCIFDQSHLEDLARKLGEGLCAQGLQMVTAESCTGGWIAQTATAIPGSSTWVERGYVTYSNRAKVEILGVPEDIIATHGAVSRETAGAMAAGALRAAKVDIAVAVTGVAGPDGGTDEKPVGTVWFGWCRLGSDPVTKLLRFGGDRQDIRAQTVAVALQGLCEMIGLNPNISAPDIPDT